MGKSFENRNNLLTSSISLTLRQDVIDLDIIALRLLLLVLV